MKLVHDLRTDGIHVPEPMSVEHVNDIRAYLIERPLFHSHVAAKATEQPRGFAGAVTYWKVFSPYMWDLLLAPHWFELALGYFPAAKEYFGQFARLYSVNAFWTCAVNPETVYKETQSWHRDGDDAHQFTIFMFGSDVLQPEDGEHLFQRGTHLIDDNSLGRDYRLPPPEEIVTHVKGPRGTMLLADTNGLHRAIPPRKPRLLLWARYGVMNPPRSHEWDRIYPMPKGWLGDRYPSDPELQEAVRLIVN